MAQCLQLLLRGTLLCGFYSSCYGSSSPNQEATPICMPENCCEIHLNQDGREEKILLLSFLSSSGYTVNCSLVSNGTFDDVGIHECKCVSKSDYLLAFSNFTRIYRATVSFQEVQSEEKRSKGTSGLNCTAIEEKNCSSSLEAGLTPCNASRSNHTSQIKCVFSFESFISTTSDTKFVLQVIDYNNTRLEYKNASGEITLTEIAALLILGVLFVLLLLIIIGLCMMCQLKVTLRSQSNYSRTLPKISMDEASIATYASVKYPCRQVLTDYHEVDILPSVSEVDEIEVFEAADVNHPVPEGRVTVNEKVAIANEASVDVHDNGNDESAKTKTVPRVKKPSVVYAFIKKTKST